MPALTNHRRQDIALALCLLMLSSACKGPELGLPQLRQVQIDNASGTELLLYRARRDGWLPPRALRTKAQLELRLPPGRYALQLGPQGPKLPLPLPPAELGYAPPANHSLRVWPWPKTQEGWCWIPAGPGLRGDELGVGQEDERPLSTPHTPGFWLAARETSNAEYVRFLNALPATAVERRWLDFDGAKCRIHWDPASGKYSTDAPRLPVATVSWHGAVAYCAWLTRRHGIPHRLPTETEWERAARGPGSRIYAYGDTCRTPAANQESGRLREIGKFAPNGFGLFDMTGNVFEWTVDRYRADAYQQGPHRGTGGEFSASFRVLRGGSFVLDGIFLRNSMRMRLRPEVRADDVGFRVLRENTDPRYGPLPARSKR